MSRDHERDQPVLPALLADRQAYQDRLALILPPEATGSTAASNPAAASLAFTMMYVGAVGGVNPIRPATAYWMGTVLSQHRNAETRMGYYAAARRSEKAVLKFCTDSGFERGETWYAQHTREPMRDETLRSWVEHGAVLVDHSVNTTSPKGRYTLSPAFAQLLNPDLTDDALSEAIKKWQATSVGAIALTRINEAQKRLQSEHEIPVTYPDGRIRMLKANESSWILKGVIEVFAKKVMGDPKVLFVSESQEKATAEDAEYLKKIGIPLAGDELLPDCLIMDLDLEREEFWFIEAVFSDGPISQPRKELFLRWVSGPRGIPPEKCRFLTAFLGRGYPPAKTALPKLADNSYAWYIDEPDKLLTWRAFE